MLDIIRLTTDTITFLPDPTLTEDTIKSVLIKFPSLFGYSFQYFLENTIEIHNDQKKSIFSIFLNFIEA